MKDSRIGTYAALGLLLAVGLSAALLIALPPPLFTPALVASAAFGRWAAVMAMAAIPPIDQGGSLVKDIGQRPGAGIVIAVTVLTLPFVAPFALLSPLPLAVAVLATLIFLAWLRGTLLRRLGGVVGDGLGFAVYAAQLFLLLAAAAACPSG